MERVMRAQLLLAQGDHAGALAEFDTHWAAAMADGLAFMKPVLYADIAWCKCQLGRFDEALADARSALAIGPDCKEEHRASTHGRLAQVFTALKRDAEAQSHAERAAQDQRTFQDQQARIVALLDAALKQVPDLPR
jgi:tetratricopeptide (TPR) repeat protein